MKKSQLYSTALTAGVLGLLAVSEGASAATLVQTTISSTTSAGYSASTPTFQGAPPTPIASTGSFQQDATGDNGGVSKDPYGGTSNPAGTEAYSNLGGGFASGSATYNIGSTSVTVLWGSPDTWNEIEFFSGADGVGLLDAINCSSLTATGCSQNGYDLVTFSFSPSTVIGSIIVEDPGTIGSVPADQSFEYDIIPGAATPLPAALPLFAGGLGLMGLLGRRRKRKDRTILPA